MQKKFFIALMFVAMATMVKAQVSTISELIKNRNDLQEKTPREKLYLHLDKHNYLATDTIWYKAYLTKALNNNYSPLSGVIYFELFDGKNDLVKRFTAPAKYGFAWGQIALDPQTMLSGKYVLQAYTNWMRNFGDSLFYKTEIHVQNVQSQVEPEKALSGNQGAPDFQFLPEGGNWVAGMKQKLAYKVIDASGKGMDFRAKILNQKNETVAELKPVYKGMGFVDFTPNPAEVYTAVLSDGRKYALPKLSASGTILQVRNTAQSDSLEITINGSKDVLSADHNYFLMGTSRGLTCFGVKLRFKGVARTLKIAKNAFPTGVCRISLLNAQFSPLNERATFINHNDQLRIGVLPDKRKYTTRGQIDVKVKVSDPFGKPVRGNFSLAVTDDSQALKDSLLDENIVNYQFLTADLKGNVETPNYYFSGQPKEDALEALLLTQGWVSYGVPQNLKFSAETDYMVSGKVTNAFNKPLVKTGVTLFGSARKPLIIDTLTDNSGRFEFNHLPAYDTDSISYMIRAVNKNKKTFGVGLTVNAFRAPQPPIRFLKELSYRMDTTMNAITAIQKENYKRTAGIQLREVDINTKKAVSGSRNLNGPGEADQVLTNLELSREPKLTLEQFLMKNVKGFRFGFPKAAAPAGLSGTAGQGIKFDPNKNRDYVVANKRVRLIIDGIDADMNYNAERGNGNLNHYDYLRDILSYFTADDVKGVEIMKTPRYNMAYMNVFTPEALFNSDPVSDTDFAFIAITTKSGEGPFFKKPPGVFVYRPLAANPPKQFYSPRYPVKRQIVRPADFRSTLYWNPSITTDEKGEAAISFFSSDQKGTYTIWIEGTNMADQFGVKVQKVLIE
uniref:carboxypeptidase-like regulatory domain-containing protein n=1 Tax=Pedobacter schmidteae TaxID=2201271 RepID=UPI0013CF00F2|nr:carboxypeptidase-like regulatory domain-containing protein [Pedobacter schmidteae]